MAYQKIIVTILVLSLAGTAGCGSTDSLDLKSPAFEHGGTIPTIHSGDGENVSPELNWSDPPDGTVSFALVCEDPDAPSGTFIHWVIYNIPGTARTLATGVSDSLELTDGTRQGRNDFKSIGYLGPYPPPGKPHRYFFVLYALDTMLELAPGATRSDLEGAMEDHILAEGRLMGKYSR